MSIPNLVGQVGLEPTRFFRALGSRPSKSAIPSLSEK